MSIDICKMRNIGISAHIDSGKTTLSERILFYSNKIHVIREVRGKDGAGATMDSMDIERERGITIQSAATQVEWKEHTINLIDTPGHVDFTIEVERSLRVLDGAILVLCAVGGVQSQSITVDRQLKRYHVPRIAFVNKCDRAGANPFKVKNQLREKLGLNAVMIQIPIGLEDKLEGVVDLVTQKALYFDGDRGEIVRCAEIPAHLKADVEKYREEMLDAVSMFDDTLMELLMEGGDMPETVIRAAIRKGTLAEKLVPVMIGSAYKNKGVQPLLDGVTYYLPNPTEVKNNALDIDHNEEQVELTADAKKPTVALGFKLEDGKYGQLTYVRIYQGELKKGDELMNTRARKRFKVGRLVRMHANTMEDIGEGVPGDIVALFGIECASGDTFCGNGLNYAMSSMYVPEPVISLAITPKDKKSADQMAKALNRFTKEDPTFQTFVDPESNQTIIKGMGELHLDVYITRMRREYNCEVETGMPQVAYREAITARAEFNYTHKKQTGGSGQYGRVAGYMEPCETDYEFVDNIKGGAIPTEYIPSCDKGFRQAIRKGSLIGFPIVNIRCLINDGQSHPVDSSDIAFQSAAIGGFREAYAKAKPCILEPIMRVAIEGPTEFQGNIFASINQRRGIIVSSTEDGTNSRVEAEVPLSEMFGYSPALRGMTQGKAEFSMEFEKYGKVPASISDALIKEYEEKRKKEQK
ncbi:MAG: elongation factor G [Treponema sp.]|jgi:elongation factor G|nr:elongation factor G [Treponema sp.]